MTTSDPIVHRSGGVFLYAQPTRGRAYEGVLRLPGSLREASILLECRAEPARFAFYTSSPELSALLQHDPHRQRLAQCRSPADFLAEVRAICERATLLSSTTTDGPSSSTAVLSNRAPPAGRLFRGLFQALERIGLSKVAALDTANLRLSLVLLDRRGRRHELHVRLPGDFPDQPPLEFQLALPARLRACSDDSAAAPRVVNDEGAVVQLRGGHEQLRDLLAAYRLFERELDHYQPFWDVMDDIDGQLWVLEPARPSRSTTFRRVAVLQHCSLQLVVDPAAPTALPDLRILGAEARTAALRQQLASALPAWNPALLPRANLEAVLAVQLPSRATSRRQDYEVDCGICYAYRLPDDGSLPASACDNDKCPAVFHRACLLEWLRSLPTSHTSYATTYGLCPYCSESIHA